MAAEKYEYEYFNVSFPQPFVAVVETNRPEKLNAYIEIMWLNLGKIMRRLSHSPDVRAIVITAVGDRAFTAGLDVQAASQGMLKGNKKLDGARTGNALRRSILEFQECLTEIEKCEKPVIVALHGICYGLAIDLSLAGDIRLASADAAFSVKEADIGMAADVGTLSRLPKAVGSYSWAKDVCLTARIFGAEEALRFGFVSGVFPTKRDLLANALETATLLASKSPVAVMGTKHLLDWSRDHTVEDGLRYTAAWNAGMLQTRDLQDALLSGIQKRKPTFEKL